MKQSRVIASRHYSTWTPERFSKLQYMRCTSKKEKTISSLSKSAAFHQKPVFLLVRVLSFSFHFLFFIFQAMASSFVLKNKIPENSKENADHTFLELKVRPSNCLFCPTYSLVSILSHRTKKIYFITKMIANYFCDDRLID